MATSKSWGEYGANVYMPQAHLGAPNSPVLEKIHAWNYSSVWKSFMEAGTVGGTNFRFDDYNTVNTASWDMGYTNFGVVTADNQPKLACWILHNIWRDIDAEPLPAGNQNKG